MNTITFNHNSLNTIFCSDTPTAVVYGRDECRYEEVQIALSNHLDKPIFDYEIGRNEVRHEYEYKLDGNKPCKRNFYKMDRKNGYHLNFKSGIVNLLLENYLRKKEELLPIPLIFVIESSVPYILESTELEVWLDTPEDFNFHKAACEPSITSSEIRRCFKVCHEFNETIIKLALETIKFVKLEQDFSEVQKNDSTVEFPNLLCKLTLLEHFWDKPEWKNEWAERKKSIKARKVTIENPFNWRTQFLKEIESIDELFSKK